MRNQDWIERARRVLPAGGFGNYDPSMVIARGEGSRVWDADGREYVDYLIGSGPMLLGHGHPEVIEAIERQMRDGFTFFANNPQGIELAEVIVEAVPCAEQLRYLSSGGEADMYAMRLARAHTGRDKILKFEGGYHGMSAESLQSLFPTAPSNFPQAQTDGAGIPRSVAEHMLIAPFNDLEAARQLVAEHADELAAMIVEPLQRLVPPEPGFLAGLRELCDQHGIVLIFDEVVTGFRFAWGGAQSKYGVTPDLCTLGKTIGGGLPLAAVVGSKAIMDHFDKSLVGASGFTVQIGTLSGNPLAAAAGLKTLEILAREGSFEQLYAHGERLMQSLTRALQSVQVPHQIVGEPVLFDVVFGDHEVRNYRDVLAGDSEANATFNRVLREQGIFKSPGKLYPNLALTEADHQLTEQAFATAAQALKT